MSQPSKPVVPRAQTEAAYTQGHQARTQGRALTAVPYNNTSRENFILASFWRAGHHDADIERQAA